MEPHRDVHRMPPYLLGVDSGLTVTKAVVFNLQGEQVGCGSVRCSTSTPHPRWVERDMEDVWSGCVQAIRAALIDAQISAGEIAGIGVTAHGDGIYLLDHQMKPARPAILSLDSRAWDVVQGWKSANLMDAALALTGQQPYQAAPASLLGWIKTNEPEVYKNIRWAISCKDWIRYKLTGEIATDPTEASTSFTNVRTQKYAPEAFKLLGLEEMREKVAPIVSSIEFAGKVTDEAAQATGLMAGTPVATGLHDVDACALGSGCVHPGQVAVIAGTYSINEVISTEPVLSPNWICRNFIVPNQWMSMSISPASATNLEWFVREFCGHDIEKAKQSNVSPFAFVNEEIERIMNEPTAVYFLPFIYGSPFGEKASGSFLGLRGWHTRAHMLRAIYEGVVFNHKTHVDYLSSAFPISEARLTGGGAKSKLWSQMFADALNQRVIVTDAEETGALGTAICAGLAAGLYSSLDQAMQSAIRVVRVHEPDAQRHADLSSAYDVYLSIIQSLSHAWERMDS